MRRPALGHLLGYTALTVILTAGAAQSLSGSNTVFSDDIAPGQVKGSDLAANSVSGGKILNGSVTGSDVKDGSLTGAEVADNSIKGADVDEATLAAICPAGMTRVNDLCYGAPRASDAQHLALNDCGDETLRLPTLGEARMMALHIGGNPEIWTDGTFAVNGTFWGVYTTSTSWNAVITGTVKPYRCVTTVGARP